MSSRRATIYTLGCRLNQAEASLLSERFVAAGYAMVDNDADADVCVINTCTVTHEADAKSRKTIRAFVRKHPRALIAVVGCYSQLSAETIASIPGVDLVLGTASKLDLVNFIGNGKRGTPLVLTEAASRDDFEIDCAGSGAVERRANLKIQDGCNCHCAYCLVPLARGPARSRYLDNLLEEARQLAGRGVKEIVLTGVNMGAYTCEGHTLLDVVDGINAIPALARIRIGSLELQGTSQDLLERMADPAHALTPFLHIPLQSASERVLARMNRASSPRESMAFLENAVRLVPGIGLGTDVLIGFPGETEDSFDETLRFVEDAPFSNIHVFKYSVRPGTVAAGLDGKVSPPELDRRSTAVRQLADVKRRTFHAQYIGREVEVLFEQQEHGYWCGYTGNYLRVAVRSDESLENTLARVTIMSDEGKHVLGLLHRGS